MTPRGLSIAVAVLLAGILGVGFYALHLKRKAQQLQPISGDTRPVAPPAVGSPAQVTLAMANDRDGTLASESAQIILPNDATKRAKEILRALVARYRDRTSPHSLGPGADINEVFVTGKLAVIDVNAAFANSHPSGILTEELTLASLAQTLAANFPGVTEVKLLVDGQERTTLAGHADLSEPYDVVAAARLLK